MSTSLQSASDLPPEADDYSPLSGAAIGSFALSLFSPVALLSPVLAILGLLPVMLGFIATRQIRRSQVRMKGRSLALAGIAVSLFFMTASLVGYTLVRQHISAEAQRHFAEWLEYVRADKLYEAHELHRQYSKRQLPGTDLEAIYTKEITSRSSEMDREEMMAVMQTMDFTPKDEFAIFYETPPMPTMLEHQEDATFEFLRLEAIEYDRPDTEVVLRYRMNYREGGAIRNLDFLVWMLRSRYEGGEFHWVVFDLRLPAQEG